MRAERLVNLLGGGGPDLLALDVVDDLLLDQGVLAAQQQEHELVVNAIDEGLDLPRAGRTALEIRQVLDRPHAGRGELLGRIQTGLIVCRLDAAGRLLEVRRVAAAFAGGDPVLARIAAQHELDGLIAPHGARGRLHGHCLEAEPLEDAAIRFEVTVERHVEPVPVDIHGIRVLHGELAHPQQAALRAGLVAELPLELVPDLGKLLVRAQLAGQVGEDFFVGHAQAHLGAPAILELEHLRAHGGPAARPLPDLARMQAGQTELESADPLHLLAHDPLDLAQYAVAQRQQRVHAGHQLPDEARPYKQLVAHGLRVGGVVAQCGDEDFRPAHGMSPLMPLAVLPPARGMRRIAPSSQPRLRTRGWLGD